jgi:Septum formation
VNERWVCRRCFHSNDGNVGACANCGLARGSEVPAGEEGVPAAAPQASGGSGWSGLLRFAWIPIVIVVVGAGILFAARRDDGGQIVGAGDMQVTDVRAGDCFDLKDPDDEEIEDVSAKPCTEPHEFEMFFVGNLPDGPFPADSVINAYLETECIPAFDAYVGMPYAQSQLDIFPLIPSPGGWSAGDHAVQCALFDPIDEELTSSMRNSGR